MERHATTPKIGEVHSNIPNRVEIDEKMCNILRLIIVIDNTKILTYL